MPVISRLNKTLARHISCVIYRGNSDNIIAEMHRNKTVQDKVGGMKQFSVTIYPNVDYIFVIALSVVLNEINVGGGDGGAVGGGGGGGCGGGCGGGG
ncbi:hypothetical protein MKW94_011429 [Papaver nudicaule]|uniref:Uncharacterized protein n=1 Tax=Papaver nudicaule TaxID=74823 RepID=A0AA41VJA7_PAPNU|nr:hypothetical protein [Papaver nudicaule]